MGPLTVVFVVGHPSARFQDARLSPEGVTALFRVFEALFDLDTLVGSDGLSQYDCVTHGGIECLMTPSLNVVNILANHLPVFQLKYRFTEDFVGVSESVQDET